MTLRSLKYGNYGIFLIMGNAGFCPSAVLIDYRPQSTICILAALGFVSNWTGDFASKIISTLVGAISG